MDGNATSAKWDKSVVYSVSHKIEIQKDCCATNELNNHSSRN
jgi:hypothetical protein